MISKKTMLITSIIFVLIIALAGCTSKEPVTAGSNNSNTGTPAQGTGNSINTQPPAQEPKTEVATLSMFWPSGKNWDADAEIDGIELTLEPKDSKDSLVKTDGTLSARLYQSDYESIGSMEKIKGDLIQEWNDISINKANFDWSGAKVRLEYKSDFKPKEYQTAWLEVTFKTKDGKEFNAIEKSVFLG